MIFHVAKIHIILFSSQKKHPTATHFFSPIIYGPPFGVLTESLWHFFSSISVFN